MVRFPMGGLLRESCDSFWLHKQLADLLPRRERKALFAGMRRISQYVPSPHNESHILAFAVECLRRRELEGVVVEAGCFKGSSTAKFSLVADLIGKQLVVFDSFQGLPDNTEPHMTSTLGHSIEGWFEQSRFRGSLSEVRANVERYGALRVCEFVPGWFHETMPSFDRPVAAAYLDVDLASSTRTCLTHLWPLVSEGGVVVSQDGDFPLVIDVFSDEEFWRDEIGCARPAMEGLGESKIVTIYR